MSKRDKKMSVLNTLNRLNEEDENALTQAEEEKRRLEEEKINSLNEYALEKLKLKDTIDGVFKVLPYCAPASVNLNDASRLESLEQLLIDQLILKQNNDNNAGEQSDYNKPKSGLKQHSNYLSPSEYGSYLSSNAFNKNSPFNQQTSSKADNDIDNEQIEKLDLNKLNLNNDCLKLFSIDNLIGLHTPTPPPPPSNEDETEFKGSEEDSLNDEESSQKTAPPTLPPPLKIQNQKSNKTENENNDFKNPEHFSLMKNSSKIKLLNLSQNNLTHLPPISLLGMFNNLEYIDLSENMFESIHLISLIRFKSLKGINLSGNMLKSFKAIDNSMENASSGLIDDALDDFYQENVNKLASTLFLTVERINLSNNQLKSQSCLLITQFKNLKYLNLSNNNFQITSTSVETQLPWQKSMSQLKNLIELNLSKNNKSVSSAKSAGQPQLVISPLPTMMPQQKSFRADSELSNVSKLSYAGGLNQALNKSFNALVNLRILDLSENNLHNMPADIKDLKNLEDLNFNSNFLHFIPNELTELRLLKRLSLRDNCITELNENFCTYSRFRDVLVRLDLSKNQLSNDTLTYKIALFESLKELDLSDNRFEAIPNTLPINLVELNMNNNKIKTLMIRPLSQAAKSDVELLKALNINLVKKDETVQKKSAVEREVEKLLVNQKRPNTTSTKTEEAIFNETIYDQPDVDQSEEMSLPHVFYLRQLKCLRLRDNHLLDVPADFGILNSNLEYFDLANNMLTQVSVSLCRGLGFLKYLNLTSNRIRELTDKLRELSELEYLNLSFNRLTSLNYELCNDLRNLKELYLNNNNLETLPSFGLNKRNKENTDINTNINNNNDENPVLPFGRSTSSLSNTRVSAFGKRKNFFTFSLPNLVKIDLSSNKFKQSFSLYSAFALASKLVEINLSANKIAFIDIDFSSVGSGNLSSAAIVNESNVKLAVDLAQEQRKSMNDDDKVKKISTPKYRLSNLKLVNLSNNDMIFNKGGFTKLLCNIYKLAPNLKAFYYDQQNGSKLGPIVLNPDQKALPAKRINSTNILNNNRTTNLKQQQHTNNNSNDVHNGNLVSLVDEDFYFDYDGFDIDDSNFIAPFNNSSLNSFHNLVEYGNAMPNVSSGGGGVVSAQLKKRNESYVNLINNLEVIDLSYNNFKKIPGLIYEMKNLKEIYFNGNLLKKIPNEMYTKPPSPEDQANFERLKELQQLKIEEELRAERRRNNEEEDFEDEELEEVKPKKKNKKGKKKGKQEEEMPQIEPIVETISKPIEPAKLLAESLEVIQLNSNKIEHVPENLFSNFKSLREIKLKDNPLKEPPQESVCISAVFKRNASNLSSASTVKTDLSQQNVDFDSISTITLLEKTSNKIPKPSLSVELQDDTKLFNKFNLPNLFFETNENLKPLQSYMDKYKKREDLLLCNMFMLVKDNIDSEETLLKLMRRLKMPMDKVEYVCREIRDSVTKNWNKIALIEYPQEPGKLSLSRRELRIKMEQYILKLQSWNLLNAWRNTFGADAQSDELIRIFKLMNSNQFENLLYQKLLTLKLSSNMLRV